MGSPDLGPGKDRGYFSFWETGKTPSTEVPQRLKSYSPTQLFFMMRLSQFQRMRREMVGVVDNGDWRMRLLNKALYSTYQDCTDLGVQGEAKLLLGQYSPAN